MRTVIQTLAGAAQFTGTAGAGLVTFADLPLPANSEDEGPVVVNIALENLQAEQIPTVDCFFKVASEALTTTQRITVRTLAASRGFSLAGCRIAVPRFVTSTPTIFVPWELVLITTGKALVASFVVSYQLGSAIQGG